jgi:hypothetical protein
VGATASGNLYENTDGPRQTGTRLRLPTQISEWSHRQPFCRFRKRRTHLRAAQPRTPLPLPSQISEPRYQELLYPFLEQRTYTRLGWAKDKRIRDTGPYLNGTYFGTHPAVRVYYSPDVITWLENDRQGDVPNGGMIIKEMYPPPAVRYQGSSRWNPPVPMEWTVMVRDSDGSVDGWYWSYYNSNPSGSNPPSPQQPDNDDFPFNYPDSGFGSYCVRCHASAERQLTFITTENIEGCPGEPIEYEVDDSWMTDEDGPGEDPHPNEGGQIAPRPITTSTNEDWLAFYPQFGNVRRSEVAHIPPVTTDRAVADGHREFVSSDQCMSCHAGDNSPFGPNMILNGFDLSPFGEWRWSLMGLAGRDPVFYAQVETESNVHGYTSGGALSADEIQNLCLHCHGVMGQRQFIQDRPGELFTVEKAMAHEQEDPHSSYGALARDGVSCMSCHRIADDSNLPLQAIQTGDFLVDPPVDGEVTVYGPFAAPTEFSMLESLRARPLLGAHLQESRLCASCHTVFLPVLDDAGQVIDGKYEQSTYLEWLNSGFRADATKRSCQDCHMAFNFDGVTLDDEHWKIANIQDQDFPPTSFLAELADITIHPRDGFRRHNLLGINSFVMELFRQYPDILGVRTKSFMTGFTNGLDRALENANNGATLASGQVEIGQLSRSGDQLEIPLEVTSFTGHRLPSGVSFRRLFLEVLVLSDRGQVVWGSGRTNDLGALVDRSGAPLPTELRAIDPTTGKQRFQPHYQVVDSEDKVQIYTELIKDSQGRFTTSFLARAEIVKDNRLLPFGWKSDGGPELKDEPKLVEATAPHGLAAQDPDFTDGMGRDQIRYLANLPPGTSGSLSVRATLYYQAIPPSYLMDRFNQASGPATRRLHYFGVHLDDSSTSFPGWKQLIGTAEKQVP